MAKAPPVKSSRRPARRKPVAAPVVVAIGAGGAAIASLEALAAGLIGEPGAAYVVALKQADSVDASALADRLDALKPGWAQLAIDGVRLQAGRLYVAPSEALTTLDDGHLSVTPAHQPPGERGSIDSLLVSLAEALNERAIGVVLRRVAPDGVAGVTAIKENGGLTIAELGEQPDGDDPQAVDPAGLVDFALPIAEIAGKIAGHVRRLQREAPAASDTAPEPQDDVAVSRIAAILRGHTGHDFHGYKQATFLRRVQRRMQVAQVDDLDAYIDVLGEDPEEVNHLFQDLLIGVTQFFRDAGEFGLIEREVIPKLFEGKEAADQIRIWVLGCATGEEAYTLAILVREHMAKLDAPPAVQIFATDIDGRALSIARAGRYPEAIAKDLTPERLARWFAREGATFCVVKELREMCVFSQHNVVRDPPFSRIDLVSCRNLLIYLTSELQDRVIPLFHFALKSGGYLFLGPSESVTRHVKLFAAIDRRHRVYRRLESATRLLPEFPLAVRKVQDADGQPPPPPRSARLDASLARRAERLAERHAPAYVLIDAHYDVLQFSGRTGRYLEPAAGAANLNLFNLVHRDLRVDLRAALHSAGSERRPVTVEGLQTGAAGDVRRVDLVIEPVFEADTPPFYVVLFRDAGAGAARAEPTGGDLRDEHVERLEGELRVSKERLQSTVEELESTNEELKSSNEEYQSINEEMQSANEELETSKEELQSVNEELHTVNGELGHRVSELGRSNSDLKNLLESTQIATVFIDNELRIRNFTPSVADVFHLIDSDLGRPIIHIASRLVYPELEADVRRVLRTLNVVEREVTDAQGASRHLVRALPYRSVDNFIAGAVLTFSDITEVVRTQTALRQSEARYRQIVESATDYAIITMDTDRVITGWNPGADNIFGWTEAEMVGKSADDIFTPDDRQGDVPGLEMSKARDAGRAAENRWHVRRSGARFWASGVLLPLRDAGSGYVKILHDRTEEREAEERQRLLMSELQHRVKNIVAVVRSIASRTQESASDLDEFAAHFDGRLSALARTVSVLARTGEGRLDLDELVREELLSHAAHDGRQVQIDGPPVTLRDKPAETFALALHELATNAVKYGALSTPKGKVTVTWRILNTGNGPKLSLDWREQGVPAIDATPRRTGFGRSLIERGLPYELGAATSLEFKPGGVRCTIELPIDQQDIREADDLQGAAE